LTASGKSQQLTGNGDADVFQDGRFPVFYFDPQISQIPPILNRCHPVDSFGGALGGRHGALFKTRQAGVDALDRSVCSGGVHLDDQFQLVICGIVGNGGSVSDRSA